MHALQPRIHRGARIGRLLALFSFTALFVVAGACSSTRSMGEQVDDAVIVTSVKTKLAADPEVNPFNVDVDSEDGRVRLSGTVDDEATRQEAEKLARSTKGVLSVNNELKVGNKRVGESAADGVLVGKVKVLLAADPDINPFNIDVDAENAVVTLSGTLASQESIDEALKLARSVKGVERVKSRLKVKEN